MSAPKIAAIVAENARSTLLDISRANGEQVAELRDGLRRTFAAKSRDELIDVASEMARASFARNVDLLRSVAARNEATLAAVFLPFLSAKRAL
jgi:hypothetical protein